MFQKQSATAFPTLMLANYTGCPPAFGCMLTPGTFIIPEPSHIPPHHHQDISIEWHALGRASRRFVH